MLKRKHTWTVCEVRLAEDPRCIVHRSGNKISIENGDCAKFLEHKRLLESRPQDHRRHVEARKKKTLALMEGSPVKETQKREISS